MAGQRRLPLETTDHEAHPMCKTLCCNRHIGYCELVLRCQSHDYGLNRTQQPSLDVVEAQHYPHKTQFSALIRNEVLTRGFAKPSTLADEADFFNRDATFDVRPATADAVSDRHVLVVLFETDRQRLLCYLAVTLLVALGAGLLVGGLTKSIATGAEMCGCLVGLVAALVGLVKSTLK